jgi:hypothetical protein
MGTYFKSLRRKLGVVTLVLACVFTVGWVRSLELSDSIWFKRDFLTSGEGFILWSRSIGRLNAKRGFSHTAYEFTHNPYNGRGTTSIYDWRRWGFAYGKKSSLEASEDGQAIDCMTFYYCAPFWSIVIPLTLLSAWLLLSKRQTRTTPVEPVPETAV